MLENKSKCAGLAITLCFKLLEVLLRSKSYLQIKYFVIYQKFYLEVFRNLQTKYQSVETQMFFVKQRRYDRKHILFKNLGIIL